MEFQNTSLHRSLIDPAFRSSDLTSIYGYARDPTWRSVVCGMSSATNLFSRYGNNDAKSRGFPHDQSHGEGISASRELYTDNS